jgi:hypothetical protein
MRFGLLGISVLGIGAALAGCSADPIGGGRAGTSGSGFENPIGGTSGGGAGGIGNPGGFGGQAGISGAPAGAGGEGVPGCGGENYVAENRPIDIYVIMDESLSMLVPVDIWTPTSTALNTFFSSPEATGIGVGIQFFSGGCDVPAYATPVVPVADLPGNAGMLMTALANRFPGPGTATEPAVRGAIQFAAGRAAMDPTRKQVVLLVTDGEPASCGATVESTAAAAAEGYAGTPSIPTYVLGLGDINGLNAMAVGGGTGAAFVVEDPMNVQAVVDAMNAIRGQALPCEYRVPAATAGEFDKDLVNLNWTRDGVTNPVPFVGGAEGCEGAPSGWYYDNIDAPTQLVACQQTCAELKTLGGDVSVVLGCPQITPE